MCILCRLCRFQKIQIYSWISIKLASFFPWTYCNTNYIIFFGKKCFFCKFYFSINSLGNIFFYIFILCNIINNTVLNRIPWSHSVLTRATHMTLHGWRICISMWTLAVQFYSHVCLRKCTHCMDILLSGYNVDMTHYLKDVQAPGLLID